jgi:hypothetical protein
VASSIPDSFIGIFPAGHTLHGTRYTLQPETHVATTLQYFYRCILLIILQKCNFSKDQRRLPEDGPDGPKHVGANA